MLTVQMEALWSLEMLVLLFSRLYRKSLMWIVQTEALLLKAVHAQSFNSQLLLRLI